jgi:DNA-binding response OmpR family regulator
MNRWISEYTVRETRVRPFLAKLPKPRLSFVFVEAGNSLKRSFDRYFEDAMTTSFREVDAAIEELARSPAQALVLNTPMIFTQAGCVALQQKLANLPYETPVISCWLPGKDDFVLELGVIDYIIKPINIDNLLETVRHAGEKVKKILVVDDDEDTLRLIMRVLLSAPQGYQVIRATSGELALRQMRRRKPDLVLLDIVLPEMSGLQVLNEKRADEQIRDIPVMIVSSRDPVNEKVTTNALLVNRRNGLSTRELVEFIRSVSQTLTPHVRKNDAGAKEKLPG